MSSLLATATLLSALPASAHEHDHKQHTGGIPTAPSKAVEAAFDIVHTKIARAGNKAVFHIAVSGKAGQSHPSATGKLAGILPAAGAGLPCFHPVLVRIK